ADVHELPRARPDEEREARTDPRRIPERHRPPVEEGARSAGLRLLQPQRARDARGGLRHLPRSHRSDARGVSVRAALDGLVPRLPSRALEESPAAVGSDEHDLEAPRGRGSRRVRERPRRKEQPPPPDRLFDMSPVTNKPKPRYWRSLSELEKSPEFDKFLEN